MNIDICPKCNKRRLFEINKNKYQCENCGYTEVSILTFNKGHHKTYKHKTFISNTKLKRSYKEKMTDEKKEFTPTKPAYAGNGVAIWNAEDKNGKHYFKVSVLGGKAVNCFKVEEPEEQKGE